MRKNLVHFVLSSLAVTCFAVSSFADEIVVQCVTQEDQPQYSLQKVYKLFRKVGDPYYSFVREEYGLNKFTGLPFGSTVTLATTLECDGYVSNVAFRCSQNGDVMSDTDDIFSLQLNPDLKSSTLIREWGTRNWDSDTMTYLIQTVSDKLVCR